MKYFKTVVLACTMMATAAGVASAADPVDVPTDQYAAMGFYLRGDAGWSWLNWSGHDDSAVVIGGGAGYQYNENLRADLRVDWAGSYDRKNRNNDLDVTTVLGNLYFDIPTSTMITPYLGAGAGYGWGTIGHGNDKDGFAYALMAGATVDLTDSLSLDTEYRFRSIMSSGANPMEHQIMTGLRYKF